MDFMKSWEERNVQFELTYIVALQPNRRFLAERSFGTDFTNMNRKTVH